MTTKSEAIEKLVANMVNTVPFNERHKFLSERGWREVPTDQLFTFGIKPMTREGKRHRLYISLSHSLSPINQTKAVTLSCYSILRQKGIIKV